MQAACIPIPLPAAVVASSHRTVPSPCTLQRDPTRAEAGRALLLPLTQGWSLLPFPSPGARRGGAAGRARLHIVNIPSLPLLLLPSCLLPLRWAGPGDAVHFGGHCSFGLSARSSFLSKPHTGICTMSRWGDDSVWMVADPSSI